MNANRVSMSEKRAKIKDVADATGVSMMTVSRVMNNDPKVSDKTRNKILAAAKKLDYRPNIAARRLASAKSFFIGLLYDNPSASYVSQFLLGALQHCRTTGYHLVVDKSAEDISQTLVSVADLIDITKVDGLILLPPVCDDKNIITLLDEKNVPYVRISPDTELSASPYVCLDDYQAAFDITSHLIDKGHQKIAHISGHPNQGASRLREQGYLDAMKTNGLSYSVCEQGFFSYRSGLKAAQALLNRDDKPTAIFAANDDMAAASIAAAHMNNISIPDELSIVGFDDTELATTVWPTITTVRQPIKSMAELAIDILISGNLAEKKNDKQLRHVLDFSIVERESSL